MKRDAVVFYRSFYEAIMELPRDSQLDAFLAVIEYGLDGEEPSGGLAKAVYLMAKPQIDANNRRYENGKKGGAPVGNQNAKKQPTDNQKQPKNNQKQPKEKVKEKEKEKVKAKNNNISALETAIDNYKEHRKQIKAPMTAQAEKLMMNKLEKLSGGNDQTKIDILNQSIENGWRGIFPLKQSKFNNAPVREYSMNELELKLLKTNCKEKNNGKHQGQHHDELQEIQEARRKQVGQ